MPPRRSATNQNAYAFKNAGNEKGASPDRYRLDLFELAPDLDRSVFIGHGAAETYLDHANLPTRVLVRSNPAKVDQVLTVLAATANPQYPEEVTVDKPSDALEAQKEA